nr:MAG TPA: hypothetical protein [Caudoviricetes sp.]
MLQNGGGLTGRSLKGYEVGHLPASFVPALMFVIIQALL